MGSFSLFKYVLNLNGLLSGCLVRATYVSSTFSRLFCLRFIVSDATFLCFDTWHRSSAFAKSLGFLCPSCFSSFCGMLLSYRRCILVDYIVCGQTQKEVDGSVPWSCVLLSCTSISFTYGLLAIEWWSGDQIRSEKAGGRVLSRISLLRPLRFRFVSLSSRSLFL